MLTLFSVPKAFEGHNGIIQDNALASWARLGGGTEVFLIGDDEGTAEAAARYGFRHLGSVDRTRNGTPIVKSAFEKAEAVSKHELLCFVNADIILMGDFLEAIQRVSEEYADFLLISRRWDLDIREPLDFGSDWESLLKDRARRTGVVHRLHGADFFAYRSGMFSNMPPFAIGRTIWDNWLMYAARAKGAPLVDATPDVMAVHQAHDYVHVPGGKQGAWKGEEARENFRMGGGYKQIYNTYDANVMLTGGDLVSTYRPQYWHRHLRAKAGRVVMSRLSAYPRALAMWQKLRS